MNIWPGVYFISFEFNFCRIWRGLFFSWVCTIRGRSHIAPKNAWKTLGALLSPFFQSARAVALRRRLSLLSNHQLRSPLQEGNFVTWPAVRLRHSEKLRCFYLDAARTRLEKTSASLPLWARIVGITFRTIFSADEWYKHWHPIRIHPAITSLR